MDVIQVNTEQKIHKNYPLFIYNKNNPIINYPRFFYVLPCYNTENILQKIEESNEIDKNSHFYKMVKQKKIQQDIETYFDKIYDYCYFYRNLNIEIDKNNCTTKESLNGSLIFNIDYIQDNYVAFEAKFHKIIPIEVKLINNEFPKIISISVLNII